METETILKTFSETITKCRQAGVLAETRFSIGVHWLTPRQAFDLAAKLDPGLSAIAWTNGATYGITIRLMEKFEVSLYFDPMRTVPKQLEQEEKETK